MFDELEEFPHKDHFFFSAGDDLGKVCNAPRTGHGVFIVNELKFGRIELVCIGASAKMQANGTFRPRSGGRAADPAHPVPFLEIEQPA